MGTMGRIAALRFGRPVIGFPTSEFGGGAIRLLIAPVNYSAQATAWAAAAREHLGVVAVNMAIEVPGGFDFPADLLVPQATYHNDRDWQRRQFEAAASGATHVLIEAQEPPFGRFLDRDVARQAAALLDRGVNVAYIAHGTDVRLPSRHVQRTPWSHYGAPGVYVPRLEHVAAKNVRFLESSGRPTFVSTPDLLVDLPWARWCPVVVDVERWRRDRPDRSASSRDLLRVAHTPSVAALKGTNLIEPAMLRLHEAGRICWHRASGIPSRAMPELFARTDVLLDQFRAGSYGVAAVEAMASGCVVVGHVLPDTRAAVLEATGLELPIIEATPDTLEAVIHRLAEHPEEIDDLRRRGVDFVRAVHDGRRSAAVLGTWLGIEAVA